MLSTLPDPATQARLHDEARAAAVRLRQQAMDDFWRGADAAYQRGLNRGSALVARSAQRLQARLVRHRLARGTTPLEG